MLSYGDYLLNEKKQPSYALHLYLAMDPIDLDRSLKATRESNDWQLFFTLYDSHITSKETDHDDVNNENKNNVVKSNHAITKRSEIAKQIATELANTVNEINKKDIYEDCARILLDYGNMDSHIMEAIDYYILAESWKEAKRICCNKLQRYDDVLQNRIHSSVMAYVTNTMNDIDERMEIFQVTYQRYKEVLKIRHDANILNNPNHHDDDYDHPTFDNNDDTGSLFSSASTNASNASIRSSSSTGSVGSLSSVISIKSNTSFSITGTEMSMRHKSKYNAIGKQHQPKKERTRKTRNERKQAKSKAKKIQPGSQEELDGLIQKLSSTSCRILSNDTDRIYETILYLMNDHHSMKYANELYQKYVWFSKSIRETINGNNEKINDPNTILLASTSNGDGNRIEYSNNSSIGMNNMETRNIDLVADPVKRYDNNHIVTICYDDPNYYCPPLCDTINEIMAFFPSRIFFEENSE
jgi:hypothetical protein